MNLIEQLEKEEIERLGKNIPDFAPGDTVVVVTSVTGLNELDDILEKRRG